MATYKLKLNRAPESRTDGNISHDISVLTVDDVQSGLHKDVLVPCTEMAVTMGLPNGAAKVAAYKDMLWDNRNNRTPLADTSQWSYELLAAATGSIEQAIAANEYITVDLGLNYSNLTFTIEG